MIILGWLGGSAMSGFFSEYASWIASGILVFIGARMIYRNLHEGEKRKIDSLSYSVLFALAVTTSIDAFYSSDDLLLPQFRSFSLDFFFNFNGL